MMPATIFPIGPASGRNSLFFLPDIGGNVIYANKIVAHLGPEFAAFGMSLDAETVGRLPVVSLQDVAKRLAEDLMASDRHGPFHLVGHSFAGLVAYETACTLDAMGAQVGLVAILDSVANKCLRRHNWRYRTALAIRQMRYSIRRCRSLLLREPGSDLILDFPGFVRMDLSQHPVSYRYIITHLHRQLRHYSPSRYGGDILLFKIDHAGRRFHTEKLGWEYCVSGNIRTISIEGDHLQLVRDDRTAELVAQQLVSAIDRFVPAGKSTA